MDRQQDSIIMDAATRRNLEITQNLSGGVENTLASVLDCTVTPMGQPYAQTLAAYAGAQRRCAH
ncbi:DNA mismatch repair protein mutS [Cedecea neteri]|uniref:DNA mismatch repair protein mutS n=1 Tax=Cedecea neteri TaxID=158822 RepID=A0A2X2T616_9ENTR|nr:DNA mismatch repair protein mutS [Cedecea neteri]